MDARGKFKKLILKKVRVKVKKQMEEAVKDLHKEFVYNHYNNVTIIITGIYKEAKEMYLVYR